MSESSNSSDFSISDSIITNDNNKLVVKSSLFYTMWRNRWFIFRLVCIIVIFSIGSYLIISKSVKDTANAAPIQTPIKQSSGNR